MPQPLTKRLRSEIETVSEFRTLLEEKYQDDRQELYDLSGEEDEGIEFYADEAWVLDEVRRLAKMLALVALYRVVEHNMMKMLAKRWSEAAVRANGLYRFDRLKRFLVEELGLRLSGLSGFGAINELRLANNAVKHEIGTPGSVSNPSRQHRLNDVDGIYERALASVVPFLNDFAGALGFQVDLADV